MAPSSSARWPSTRTSTDSAKCEALRASSSCWPRSSSEAPTAFGETGGALGSFDSMQVLDAAMPPALPPYAPWHTRRPPMPRTALDLVATCAPGLEEILDGELAAMGVGEEERAREVGAVAFRGGWETCWRANWR